MSSSLLGNVAISVVAGTVAGLSAWAFGLPFPIVLGVITGLLDLIPQVGATIAAVVLVARRAHRQHARPAIAMLVIQLIYQQLENYVIYPIVYRRAVELSPLTTIAAVLIASSLLGVVGAILAVPFAAVIKIVLREAGAPRRARMAEPRRRTGARGGGPGVTAGRPAAGPRVPADRGRRRLRAATGSRGSSTSRASTARWRSARRPTRRSFPLLIVYASVLPRDRGLRGHAHRALRADGLVRRRPSSSAFAPSDDGAVERHGARHRCCSSSRRSSFTRGMQRLYEGAFGLPTLGMRNTKWGLLWLLVVCLVVARAPGCSSAAWTAPPETVALARRRGRALARDALPAARSARCGRPRSRPAAVLSTIGMTGVGIWSAIWMPHTVATSSREFGVIGVGFALLTWLVAIGVVLVVAASGGAVIAERRRRRRPAGVRITWLGHTHRAARGRAARGC